MSAAVASMSSYLMFNSRNSSVAFSSNIYVLINLRHLVIYFSYTQRVSRNHIRFRDHSLEAGLYPFIIFVTNANPRSWFQFDTFHARHLVIYFSYTYLEGVVDNQYPVDSVSVPYGGLISIFHLGNISTGCGGGESSVIYHFFRNATPTAAILLRLSRRHSHKIEGAVPIINWGNS